MIPPRSRKRICRTISLVASRFVLTIVSSSRPVRFPTYRPVLTSIAHERLGQVDHDVAARLQPDLAPKRLVDFGLDAVLFEDREVLGVVMHPWHQAGHDPLDEPHGARVLLSVIDPNRRKISAETIAEQLGNQALLAVNDRRRTGRFRLAPGLAPELVEVRQVADDIFLGSSAGGRPQDDTAREPVLRTERPHDAPQAPALVPRLDLAGHPDVVYGGREHQKAARDGHVRRDPDPLGTQGFLDDLHQDLLTGLQEVSNLGLGLVGAAWALVRVTRFETVELLEGVDDIGDVQEGLLRQPDIDERGLHAGKDL